MGNRPNRGQNLTYLHADFRSRLYGWFHKLGVFFVGVLTIQPQPLTTKTIFFCRVPIVLILGFISRTWKNHAYGSQWYHFGSHVKLSRSGIMRMPQLSLCYRTPFLLIFLPAAACVCKRQGWQRPEMQVPGTAFKRGFFDLPQGIFIRHRCWHESSTY